MCNSILASQNLHGKYTSTIMTITLTLNLIIIFFEILAYSASSWVVIWKLYFCWMNNIKSSEKRRHKQKVSCLIIKKIEKLL